MKILTTLVEDDYFLGFAALINSVVKCGTYVDKVIVGYRGVLPNWLPDMRYTERGKICNLEGGLIAEFIELKNDFHIVHEKPEWVKYVNDVLEPEADEFFFFDSDIIVLNRMSFFGDWVKQGVALCEDVNNDMSFNHPIRKQWETLADKGGLKVKRNLDRYYNSGFLGWSKCNSKFIREWYECFNILAESTADLKKFRVNDRTNIVQSANQDSLNLAVMITSEQLSTIGPAGMGFDYGFHLMVHAITEKPWKKAFLKGFIDGRPPRKCDLLFWQNVNGTQLSPVSKLKVTYKIILCKVLKFFGRFYSRN